MGYIDPKLVEGAAALVESFMEYRGRAAAIGVQRTAVS